MCVGCEGINNIKPIGLFSRQLKFGQRKRVANVSFGGFIQLNGLDAKVTVANGRYDDD